MEECLLALHSLETVLLSQYFLGRESFLGIMTDENSLETLKSEKSHFKIVHIVCVCVCVCVFKKIPIVLDTMMVHGPNRVHRLFLKTNFVEHSHIH